MGNPLQEMNKKYLGINAVQNKSSRRLQKSNIGLSTSQDKVESGHLAKVLLSEDAKLVIL
jgi:hypothetical protein